jgi:hypothetical protein
VLFDNHQSLSSIKKVLGKESFADKMFTEYFFAECKMTFTGKEDESRSNSDIELHLVKQKIVG